MLEESIEEVCELREVFGVAKEGCSSRISGSIGGSIDDNDEEEASLTSCCEAIIRRRLEGGRYPVPTARRSCRPRVPLAIGIVLAALLAALNGLPGILLASVGAEDSSESDIFVVL